MSQERRFVLGGVSCRTREDCSVRRRRRNRRAAEGEIEQGGIDQALRLRTRKPKLRLPGLGLGGSTSGVPSAPLPRRTVRIARYRLSGACM
jgi:hypothetical protein